MGDVSETVQEAVEKASEGGWLNTAAAITVAIAATFMALCNVKDDNVVQAMAAAQASGIDEWAYFQAKSTKQNMAESTADQLTIQRDLAIGMNADQQALIARKIDEYTAKAKRYDQEKAEIKAKAEGFAKEYDRLNRRDDQFDMAEASLSVAIALIGVSVLTKKKWLFGFAVGVAALGLVFGVAGFAQLDIHPDWLAKFLS
jgi:hypothetical protein